MRCTDESLQLYAITDRRWLAGKTLYSQVEEALKGGATFIQLREKDLDEETFRREAVALKELCGKYGVPFVLDDNVKLAKEIDADGVHVGQSDMEAGEVVRLLGEDKIIGVSASTVEDAVLAEKRGASYLGVGAVFPTGTKDDASGVSMETLREICQAVHIPVVAIGGITGENLGQLRGSGIAGISVISAIFAQPDVRKATEELKKKTEEMLS
uniref:Thiamine-phosphate synthase n=1 Tax=Eubacterium cellulosolvens (strain ATCC 43171 / JCM 9499 / 6) TaxID=633697 RepID=I5AS12_EUBC6